MKDQQHSDAPKFDHTPEPWTDHNNTLPKTLSEIDYDRARICVNACAGLTLEEIEEALKLFNNKAVVKRLSELAKLCAGKTDEEIKEAFDVYEKWKHRAQGFHQALNHPQTDSEEK